MTILKGYGSTDWPVSFEEILGYSRVQAGDTIYMGAGTYTGNFTAGKSGAENAPIIIKPRNYGDMVTINGNLLITGGYVRVEDLIINDTAYTDRSSSAGGHVSLDANASHLEIINCHIRNGIQGLSSSDSVVDVFIYGCIFRLCGWLSQLGHGLYPQNRYAYKTIEHCIIGDNFGYGLHAWGSSGYVNHWKVLENIAYQNGFIRPAPNNVSLPNYQVGGQSPNEGHIIRGNISYNGEMRVGYGTGNNVTDTEISENVLVFNPPLRLYNGFSASNLVENNRFYGPVDWGASGLTSANFPNNDYLALGAVPDESFLFPNRYDSNRANLAIFNIQAQADSVQVDVSNIYEDGNVINCHNVQDYFVDIQEATVVNGMISVNMQASNRSVESAVGGYPALKTFPQFGTFVLRKQ